MDTPVPSTPRTVMTQLITAFRAAKFRSQMKSAIETCRPQMDVSALESVLLMLDAVAVEDAAMVKTAADISPAEVITQGGVSEASRSAADPVLAVMERSRVAVRETTGSKAKTSPAGKSRRGSVRL